MIYSRKKGAFLLSAAAGFLPAFVGLNLYWENPRS